MNDLKVLSINDVLNCCHDDSAGAGILYLHIDKLKEVANEPFKELSEEEYNEIKERYRKRYEDTWHHK